VKKIIIAALFTLLCISTLNAKDNLYIGANYAIGTTTKDLDNGQTQNETFDDTYFVIGKYFEDYRLFLNLDTLNNIGMEYSYLFHFDDTKKFDIFLGTGLYYHYYDVSYSGSSSNSIQYADYSDKKIGVVLSAGTIYSLNKKFEWECGIKVFKTSDDIYKNIYTGINYLF